MNKYIYYILFSALLVLGFLHGPDKDSQSFRLNKATEAVDMHAELSSSTCTLVSSQSHERDYSYDKESSNYCLTDGLLNDITSFRSTTAPTKILKVNVALMKQINYLANGQLPENKWQGLSPDTNFIKYSNRYYVYTLGHILI